MAKQAGTITIPQLQVGGVSTEPLTVNVVESSTATGTSLDIFFENEVVPQKAFLQQQVVYTIRLYFPEAFQPSSLTTPEPVNTLRRQLGDDHFDQVERDGRTYHVMERSYALFPQVSGRLEIPAPILDGTLAERFHVRSQGRQLGIDHFADTGKQVRLLGKANFIEVQSRPQIATELYWLPAKAMQLHGSWLDNKYTVQEGDPLTLLMTLEAEGLTAAQLPDLVPENVENFNVYSEKVEEQTTDRPDGVRGKRSQKIVFLPTKTGKLTLPSITLRWWDINEQSMKTLRLPGRIINVLSSSEMDSESATTPTGKQPRLYQWLALGFALLWIVTLGLYVTTLTGRKSQNKKAADSSKNWERRERQKKLEKKFRRACNENNPAAARQALLKWAAWYWPDNPVAGLDELGRRLGKEELLVQLRRLDACLYRNQQQWNGEELAKVLPRLPVKRKEQTGKVSFTLYR